MVVPDNDLRPVPEGRQLGSTRETMERSPVGTTFIDFAYDKALLNFATIENKYTVPFNHKIRTYILDRN